LRGGVILGQGGILIPWDISLTAWRTIESFVIRVRNSTSLAILCRQMDNCFIFTQNFLCVHWSLRFVAHFLWRTVMCGCLCVYVSVCVCVCEVCVFVNSALFWVTGERFLSDGNTSVFTSTIILRCALDRCYATVPFEYRYSFCNYDPKTQ